MPAKAKPPKITGKPALVSVLEANGNKPMKTKELTAKAAELAKATLRGRTPQATLAAVLATENAKSDGIFERTAPGTYRLRRSRGRRRSHTAPTS